MFIQHGPAPGTYTSVLLSGGMDSAVVLGLARLNDYHRLTTASVFHYKQTHGRETEAAKALCRHHDIPLFNYHIWMPESKFDLESESRPAELLPHTWIPGRNLIFMTYAMSRQTGCSVIAIGAHQEDQPGYPDCTEEFLLSAEHTLSLALARPIEIWAPLLNMTKTGIVRAGKKLQVPFELTWSCYAGGKTPCGKCDACIRRARAFKANDMEDPTYEKSN